MIGTWEWDSHSRLTHVSYRKGADLIDDCRYTYDDAGRPVQITGPTKTPTRFRYDAAGQLTEESGPDGVTRYEYGSGGNRKAVERPGGKAESDRVNVADELVQAGAESITYDARGNMLERRAADRTVRYTWDAQSRLTKVEDSAGGDVQFGYTAAGLRAFRKDKTGTTYFVTDGVNLLADLDDKLSVTALYVQAPGIDRPVAVLRGSEAYFYHTRALGTVSSLTDSTGKVVASYRLDAFGNPTDVRGSVPNRVLFTGREYRAGSRALLLPRALLRSAPGTLLEPGPERRAAD